VPMLSCWAGVIVTVALNISSIRMNLFFIGNSYFYI
jgi:hypothetical protein